MYFFFVFFLIIRGLASNFRFIIYTSTHAQFKVWISNTNMTTILSGLIRGGVTRASRSGRSCIFREIGVRRASVAARKIKMASESFIIY